MTKRTRAVGYIRVSDPKMVEEGMSLEAQAASIRAYAGLYAIDLVPVPLEGAQGPPTPFALDDLTAKNLDRPGLARALAMLRSGEADAVIVTKLDRLTRSVRDLSFLLEEHFREGGAGLFSVSEQIDTRTAGGRLVLNMLTVVSQWEREVIGERTRAVMRHMKRQGLRVGAVPFGRKLPKVLPVWEKGKKKPHVMLEPAPAELATILAAKALREKGLSLRQVGARLADRGMRPRLGGEWSPTQVKRLVAA